MSRYILRVRPVRFPACARLDCPSYSTFVNTCFYVSEETHTPSDSVRLFDSDADYPIRSHATSKHSSKTKNVYFTVRSVSTVGNYDYQFSYESYHDGPVPAEMRASGYIQSGWYKNNEEHGHRISDFLSASPHNHELNPKADPDIPCTAETPKITANVPVTQRHDWSGHPHSPTRLRRRLLENEDDAKIFYTGKHATEFHVVNTETPEKYSEHPGYHILPADGTIHRTV